MKHSIEKHSKHLNHRSLIARHSEDEDDDYMYDHEQVLNASTMSNKNAYGSREFAKFKELAESALKTGKIQEALSKYTASNIIM